MEHFDVLIVGAGISGIGAAVHLKTLCPGHHWAILEGRTELGGTWDLFRYPGVRSDSDMYTLGFSFRPWTEPRAIADGASILQYLKDTAREHNLYERLRFDHFVRRASWSSETARWTLTVERRTTGETLQMSCGFLLMCSGYYDYAQGHCPAFAGAEQFLGRIVHPQHWSPDVEYAGRRVIVIGSGATALTLVPALAKAAAHVTLLQRSPSYVLAVPAHDAWVAALGSVLGPELAARAARWRNILLSMYVFQLCRRLPALARKLLLDRTRRALGPDYDVESHFSPRYAPWDQRLCIAPDGDLFQVLRSGQASVVTDEIDTFTETGVSLRSGRQLAADLVVTATGLELQLLGNLELSVDGSRVDAAKSLSYRGVMFSGIPNLASCFGYTNASWTLRSELSARFVCRLLEYMARQGYQQCRPRQARESDGSLPLVDFSSGYVQRGLQRLPRQGSRAPWRVRQNYLWARLDSSWARFSDGHLEFSSLGAPTTLQQAAQEGELA
jgi:cation diffusion facilitator CzcD-associated flavoprotein CzcO